MNPFGAVERGVRGFDDFQQRHWLLAFPIGAVKKYADDRGSALASLVSMQVFLGLLPLLVVVLTVVSVAVDASDPLRDAVLDSTMAQFPVVGERLRQDVSALAAEGPWVALSVLALLWTATGIYHALQLAMNQVWNVEGVRRQGFVSRHVRALILYVLVFGAAVGTAFIPEGLFSFLPDSIRDALSTVFDLAIASLLLLAMFRIVVSPAVATPLLVPPALLAGLAWHALQRAGSWLVLEQLADAEDLYGGIGFVVVVLGWINLLARSVVFANEWAVVAWRELWPRSLAQPPLTEADRDVLVALVNNERRRPEEHIHVTFESEAVKEVRS